MTYFNPNFKLQAPDPTQSTQNANGTYTLASPSYIPPATLGSSNLSQTSTPEFQTPSYTPPPPIAGLASTVNPTLPPLTETPKENTMSGLSQRLMDLTNQDTGKSAYQSGLEKTAGYSLDASGNPTNAAFNDLSSQLNKLTTEAQQIPLQLQQDAKGQGITTGGLQPVQTAALRNNAIQALGISSLMAAQQNKLAYAQTLVKQAVQEKYGPIEAEQAAITKNLETLKNDPQTTLEEKNRADAQLAKQTAQTAQIAKNKADAATIQSWASAALANGASAYQAQQILNIGQSDNPDLSAALSLYAPYAKDPNATAKAVADLQQTRANTALTYANIGKVNADAAKINQSVNNQGDTVGSLAQQLVSGQLAPSELSKRTTGTSSYNDVLVAAGKLTGADGKPFNIAKADIQYKYANNVQTKNTLNFLTSLVADTDAYGNPTTGNLDTLINLSNQRLAIPNSTIVAQPGGQGLPALNNIAQWTKLQTGNPQIAAYYGALTEVSDQVAKILQGGGSGSGTSDAKLEIGRAHV